MKQFRHFLVLVAALVLVATSCQKAPKEIPVSSVSLNKTSQELVVGESVQLNATVNPSDATEKTITWSSSNQSVATVAGGKVTAISEGTTSITASAGGKSATCAITVKKKVIAVTSVELNKTELALVESDSETLVATVKPEDATDKTVTWSSSDATVATIDNGKVTAIKAGESTITAKAGEKSATCKVTVSKKVIPVTEITLDHESLTLFEGEEKTLVATIKPDDATDKTVTWSSSNNEVASVNEGGSVTAIATGDAIITATADEKSATCKITVTKDPMNEPIVFADQKIKEKLVTAFDTNGDGELSYKEASAVKSLFGVFGTEKDFSSFNEFQYFTGVTVIQDELFKDWNIESIVLPESITKIGSATFWSDVFSGCIFLKKVNIPDGVTYIGGHAFKNCKSLTSIIIPDSVTNVGSSLFGDCSNLKEVKLSKGLKRVENSMFSFCGSLESIEIPEGITTLGEAVFMDCVSLSSVNMPTTLTTIEGGAFYECKKLASITIPSSVKEIGKATFKGCSSLQTISIPDGISRINEDSFYNCASLITINLPNSIKYIGGSVFFGCKKLSSIIIPEGVKTIEAYTFYDCRQLVTVTIPSTVTSIGWDAFYQCYGLTSIDIPESVTEIAGLAFNNCVNLSSVIIPKNVAVIGESAFENCFHLNSITVLPMEVPTGGAKMFTLTNDCPIYVPSEAVDKYKNAEHWVTYANRIQAIQP